MSNRLAHRAGRLPPLPPERGGGGGPRRVRQPPRPTPRVSLFWLLVLALVLPALLIFGMILWRMLA